MAIERTPIAGTTDTDTLDKLYNYLLTNAVPKYFSSVTKNISYNRVDCYIDELKFLVICTDMSDSAVTVTTEHGTTKSTQGDSAAHKWKYAWKCENGISLSNSADSSAPTFTITKDNGGNTTIIFSKYLVTGENSSESIFVISPKSYDLEPKSINTNHTTYDSLTTLCPLVVSDTNNYTENAFLMQYCQYSGSGILDIDGVKYLSNGTWCVKDA